uniref:Tetraspanin n=1 Tax=Diabrotica virgifera virgifera TaxID=50390 RepID=A0A6P7G040_DIAVI
MSKDRELQMGMRCVKYMIFVANFMFMLVGLLLISIGYTIKAIYTDFDAFLSSHSYKASDLAIAVGFIILVVALFGCAGAIKESVLLVNLYALLLLVIVILELTVSIIAYKSRSHLEETLSQDMWISMEYYIADTGYIWDATQYSLHCCGVHGPNDWDRFNSSDYNLTVIYSLQDDSTSSDSQQINYPGVYQVPESCCRNTKCQSIASLYTRGCLPKIHYIISQSALLLGVGAMCITFIQLLGATFAHLLARSIRKLKTQIEVERTIRRQQLYESLAKSNTQEKVSPVLYVAESSEA